MTAIIVLWWIFLVLALLLTLVNVYLLARVVVLAGSIRKLSAITLQAAAGIASNTAVAEPLTRTVTLVKALGSKTGVVRSITGQLGAVLFGEGK